jgi:hypothetical protein
VEEVDNKVRGKLVPPGGLVACSQAMRRVDRDKAVKEEVVPSMACAARKTRMPWVVPVVQE